jgi:pSer/pThr/pTyr-binding forkhead associated (FHA) protein
MWTLQSVDPPDPSLMFRILPGHEKTMGRAPRADFIVDAALVSRLHCRFTLGLDNLLIVEDLDSTNGTWVNGRKVDRAPLAAGDAVKVGRVEFRVAQING